MEQRVNVPRQALMLATASTLAMLVCGHRAGFANAVVLIAGMLVWLSLALVYHWRARGWRDAWRKGFDGRALCWGAVGFGVPLAVSAVVWQAPSFHGLVLRSAAAAFGAVLITVFFAAILTSSMVDWYYILPRVFGLFSAPVWLSDEESAIHPRGGWSASSRRAVAQVWIFHRGCCELLTFAALAVLLAIGLVALGNAVSTDKTLPGALESLGGSGIAFGVLGYVGPRLRYGLNFMQSCPVGLGMWVEGVDEFGHRASGLVIDVSIDPGVKLVRYEPLDDPVRLFVPLRYSHHLSEQPRPAAVDSEWCREQMLVHFDRDPSPPAGPPSRRLAGSLRRWLGDAPPDTGPTAISDP